MSNQNLLSKVQRCDTLVIWDMSQVAQKWSSHLGFSEMGTGNSVWKLRSQYQLFQHLSTFYLYPIVECYQCALQKRNESKFDKKLFEKCRKVKACDKTFLRSCFAKSPSPASAISLSRACKWYHHPHPYHHHRNHDVCSILHLMMFVSWYLCKFIFPCI